MNNLRFATIVHILVLSEKFKYELITSDFIAGSINVNPVVVRREIQVLKNAKILDSKKGKDGGCFLIKDPKDITLGDIYNLITKDLDFGKKNHPNPNCPVGKQMNMSLDLLFTSVEKNIIEQLNQITLKEFSAQF